MNIEKVTGVAGECADCGTGWTEKAAVFRAGHKLYCSKACASRMDDLVNGERLASEPTNPEPPTPRKKGKSR